MLRYFTSAALLCVLLANPVVARSQTYAPMVAMSITLPDGSTQDINVRESGVGSIKAKDGTEYLVRPTVHDEPFSRATVTIFTAPTASDAGSVVGEVEARKGAPAVATKSSPSFKVAIKSIELPAKT